jgi:hypothetical protein
VKEPPVWEYAEETAYVASCEIPNIPWRLKFEGFEFERGKKKAIICVIPEGTYDGTDESARQQTVPHRWQDMSVRPQQCERSLGRGFCRR